MQAIRVIRGRSRVRTVGIWLASLALAGGGWASAALPVSAVSCTGTQAGTHVLADQTIGSLVGLRANVTYVNPTLCSYGSDAFSTQNFSIIKGCGTNCIYWIQTGHWKQLSHPTPNAFCEFTGPLGYHVIDLYLSTFTAATHAFQVQHISIFGVSGFGCFLDGAEWSSRTDTVLGFSSGDSMTVQGETDAPFSQIGALSPSKTSWTSLNSQVGASWSTLTPICRAIDSHYGHTCSAGTYQDWTN